MVYPRAVTANPLFSRSGQYQRSLVGEWELAVSEDAEGDEGGADHDVDNDNELGVPVPQEAKETFWF